jgi:hypothetical protein
LLKCSRASGCSNGDAIGMGEAEIAGEHEQRLAGRDIAPWYSLE